MDIQALGNGMPIIAGIVIVGMGIACVIKGSPEQPEWNTLPLWRRIGWCWHFWLIAAALAAFGVVVR